MTPRILSVLTVAMAFLAIPTDSPAAPAAPPPRKPWLSGDVRFFVDPNSNAVRQVAQWKAARPADAALMEELAKAPVSFWLCGGDPGAAAKTRLDQCRKQKVLPVFVLYNIPDRDAGQFSKGGEASAEAYLQWIGKFADAVGAEPAVAVLEPDALGLMDRIPEAKRAARYAMMASAVQSLAKSGSIDVYIDSGTSAWLPAAEAAKRLQQAGVEKARGFALNVSNFQRTADSLEFGRKVSALTGGKHFVIDTSRNGNGPLPKEQDKDGMGWCNPPGRAVGERPTAKTGEPLCDAFLWIKTPGESDGAFRGGPPAGGWWPEYALELMRNAAATGAASAKPRPGTK
jgi:endoglucanase